MRNRRTSIQQMFIFFQHCPMDSIVIISIMVETKNMLCNKGKPSESLGRKATGLKEL